MLRRDCKRPRKIDLPAVLAICGNIQLGGGRAPTGALGKLCNTRVSDRGGGNEARSNIVLSLWSGVGIPVK